MVACDDEGQHAPKRAGIVRAGLDCARRGMIRPSRDGGARLEIGLEGGRAFADVVQPSGEVGDPLISERRRIVRRATGDVVEMVGEQFTVWGSSSGCMCVKVRHSGGP